MAGLDRVLVLRVFANEVSYEAAVDPHPGLAVAEVLECEPGQRRRDPLMTMTRIHVGVRQRDSPTDHLVGELAYDLAVDECFIEAVPGVLAHFDGC
ncbi:hypothetical protein [Nocardioides sp. YIM 152315]|uniref:hypothetical protein n=1 Tax=Nocardioides sp. YIM 152315 TaxID=3031760 RepID=UPI0023DB0D76|nr:hypothetical protein [Nocardioides sp. YIM 152315]MDF1604081.1 hypothetical protein [Nocardioides sp. YIM 152315]